MSITGLPNDANGRVQRDGHAAGKSSGSVPPVAVRLEGARFAWRPNERDLLDIGHLEVRSGERLFLSGPSGIGKSTFLSLIGGVVSARDGQVEVLGTEITRLPNRQRDRFRADHIGIVFQMFNLVPYLSMVDNVTLPCMFSPRRRRRAESRTGNIESEARRLLADLKLDQPALLGRPVTELSIGQQQRVAVARALIGSPEIVIADEPTSALDEDARENFLSLLFAECEAEKTTLIFVSHDGRLGGQFDRRLALADLNRAAGTH